MAIDFNRGKEEVKLSTRKKEVTYKMTILQACRFDIDIAGELKPFYSKQVPKHDNKHIESNRLWWFILGIIERGDCYKGKYYKKAPKIFYNREYMINFKELGVIDDVPLELVLEHMPFLETFFDGWSLLKFEKHDKLAIHDKYKDRFVDIAIGCLSSDIFIKYERVN